MKKIVFIVAILFLATASKAQIEILKLTDFCEWCDDSLCLGKCNICKKEFEKEIKWIEDLEDTRLGEIGEGNFSGEERNRQYANLTVYIQGEVHRITVRIKFCVESKLRAEEHELRSKKFQQQYQQQTDANPSGGNPSLNNSAAKSISSFGDDLANGLQGRNAQNFQQGDIAERDLNNANRAASAANKKLRNIDDERAALVHNHKGNKSLKEQLNAQVKKAIAKQEGNSPLPPNCDGCPQEKIDEFNNVASIIALANENKNKTENKTETN